MYYDALTLACVKDELADRVLGGRVQRVVQPSELSIGLEVYAGRRYQLLLDADARLARVVLAEEKLRRGVETPSPLLLLFRKYVRGARLEALDQPPFERVLKLVFRGEQGTVTVACEIMGRYSNIILLDSDQRIMESVKRVPSSINRYRTILPQQPYVPPPPQNKENPLLLIPNLLREAMDREVARPVWRRIVRGVAGISPLLAREIVFRALGRVEPDGDLQRSECVALVRVIDEMMHLPENHDWSPSVAYETRDGEEGPIEYAPYALTHLDHEPVESISAAICLVLGTARGHDAYRQVREQLYKLIDEQTQRQEARLAALRRAQVSDAEIERLELQGNAILAMAWSIEPGQEELVIDAADFCGGASAEMHIPLDPSLSPAENAQELFGRYRKAKSAAEQTPRHIRQTELNLEYLLQLQSDVALAENRPQLDQVEQALEEAGFTPKRGKRSRPTGKAEPITRRGPEGMLILVGRNSRQNDLITFRQSSPDDLWLHAHGLPGSHVIVRSGGNGVEAETLELAARLAAYYSAARGERQVRVDYTPRRYVRHIKGAGPGMVTYRDEESIVVSGERDPSLPGTE